MQVDARRASARVIFAHRNGIDILECGHGLGLNRSDKGEPSRVSKRSRTLRRCWKCRAGLPIEYVVTRRMFEEASDE